MALPEERASCWDEPIRAPRWRSGTTIGVFQPQRPRPGPCRDQLCGLTTKPLSPCLSNWCPWAHLTTHPQQAQSSLSSPFQPGRRWRVPSVATSCNISAPSVINSFACGLQTPCPALPVAGSATGQRWGLSTVYQACKEINGTGEEHGTAPVLIAIRVTVIRKSFTCAAEATLDHKKKAFN